MNVGDWVKLKPEPLRSFESCYGQHQPAFAKFWGQQHQIIAIRNTDTAVFRYPKKFLGGTEFHLYFSQLDFVRKGAPPKCGWAGCTVKECTTIPVPPRGEHDDEDDDYCRNCGEHIEDCACDEDDDYDDEEEEEDDDDE